MTAPISDGELGERLAARTLELVDIPSESRGEGPLAAHVMEVLRAGGAPVRDLGDTCVLAGPGAPVLLAGHLDTVPAQGNRPGRRDAERVHGLGTSDMKGAVAVMLELALAGARFDCLFFGREELPMAESALTPLLAREPLAAELVVMMEPTDNAIHAGCLGNINATWTFTRPRRALRPAVGRRQRDPQGRARDRRARRARARGARLRRAEVLRGRLGDDDRGRDRHQRRPRPRDRASSTTATRPAARPRRPRRGCSS